MTSTEPTTTIEPTGVAVRDDVGTLSVAKVYPSVLRTAGEEERVPTVPLAVIQEELTGVLRATAIANGYRWSGGEVRLDVEPAPADEFGLHLVLVTLSGECDRIE